MNRPQVLVLDDEDIWLERHAAELRQRHFTVETTRDAKEAVEIATKHRSIKCAIVDEYLLQPSSPGEPERVQDWQGTTVVRKIKEKRNIFVIMVTAAPTTLKAHLELTSVVDLIIHKKQFDPNAFDEYDPRRKEETYDRLARDVRRAVEHADDERKTGPTVVVGYGLAHEAFASLQEIFRMRIVPQEREALSAFASNTGIGPPGDAVQGRTWLHLRDVKRVLVHAQQWSGINGIDDPWDEVAARNNEQYRDAAGEVRRIIDQVQPHVFLLTPGSRDLEEPSRQPTGKQLKILQILSQKAEDEKEIEIRVDEYPYEKREADPTGASLPEFPGQREIQFIENGGGARKMDRFHVVGPAVPNRENEALKLAICGENRLRDYLMREDVYPVASHPAHDDELFGHRNDHGKYVYQALFPIRAIVYDTGKVGSKSRRKRRRQ